MVALAKDYIDASVPLANGRHEAFAQALAMRTPAAEAYRRAGYNADAASAGTAGPRLARTDRIRQRVSALRAEASEACKMERADALAILSQIVLTPAGEVGPDHFLCQEYSRRECGGNVTETRKMPNKLEALRLMGQWCGWDSGKEPPAQGKDSLAEQIARIRSRRFIPESKVLP